MEGKEKGTILVVEDEANIAELVRLYLQREGFDVVVVHDGGEALESFRVHRPVLIVLDLMLPGKDGWEICREIRQISDVPIIMLTARGESVDRITGLELGADDYVVKPFDPRELVARVKAVLRRSGRGRENRSTNVLSYPDLEVNLEQYAVRVRGKQVELAPREIELLFFLASHPNQVFTREQMLERVWGYDYLGDSRTVDVHIKRIRQKIGEHDKWAIKTVWGVGYKFEVQ